MKTINHFGNEQILMETERRRFQTVKSYRTLFRHLSGFFGGRELTFREITPGMLIDFERYLQRKGCGRNTSSLYLRHMQALHNRAARQDVAGEPGKLYRENVFTGYEQAVKRGVTKSVMHLIKDAATEGKWRKLTFARDLFILSFYLRGIPFIDLAQLCKTDLRDGVIRYRRRKTGKLITVTVEPCAREIIRKYAETCEGSPYLLPILKNPEREDMHRQYDSALRLYNKHLGELARMLGLGVKLTSYTPRHTWASVAHREGIDIPYISEALGHSSEKTTRHYIQSFTADALAEVNREVIACIGSAKGKKGKRREYGRAAELFRFSERTGTKDECKVIT